jgi:hypothetical protein
VIAYVINFGSDLFMAVKKLCHFKIKIWRGLTPMGQQEPAPHCTLQHH